MIARVAVPMMLPLAAALFSAAGAALASDVAGSATEPMTIPAAVTGPRRHITTDDLVRTVSRAGAGRASRAAGN